MSKETDDTAEEVKPDASVVYGTAKRATNAQPASTAVTERVARGGVSPIPAQSASYKGAAYGLTAVAEPQPIIAAGAHPGFTFHGGPVIKRPRVFSSFWGQTWSQPANKTRADRLNQYFKDLLKSKYMNILSQYGVGAGAGAAGVFVKSTFIANVSGSLKDRDIRKIIQTGINNGVFPEPVNATNNVLVIFLGEGISVNEPAEGLVLCEPVHDTAFGYHSFFTTKAGHPFYYSIVPALDNKCLKQTCPSDANCSLHLSKTQEQRQTQVTSHEFAEMTTDPQLNAWFDGATSEENGDICNGESGTITVEGRTWTVQRMYSKFDDVQSNGATRCVTEPPNPLPHLTAGPPLAQPTAATAAQPLLTVEHLLPLPTAHFDPENGQTTLDEAELRSYVQRVFAPFSDEQLIADLPALLRAAAELLSKN